MAGCIHPNFERAQEGGMVVKPLLQWCRKFQPSDGGQIHEEYTSWHLTADVLQCWWRGGTTRFLIHSWTARRSLSHSQTYGRQQPHSNRTGLASRWSCCRQALCRRVSCPLLSEIRSGTFTESNLSVINSPNLCVQGCLQRSILHCCCRD